MKSIGQKLILISLVFALLAAGLIFAYLRTLKKPGEDIREVAVPVAADTIPPGTLITGNMIKEVFLPASTILVDYIKESSDIVGKYAHRECKHGVNQIIENINPDNHCVV